MRCVMSDGRLHVESLFKWFRKLNCTEETRDSVPTLSSEDKARIARSLQVHFTCEHVRPADWFAGIGMGRLVGVSDRQHEGPAVKILESYPTAIPCMECSGYRGALSTQLSALLASWNALLSSTAVASSFPPRIAVSLPPTAASTFSIHADSSPTCSSDDGKRKVGGAVLVAFAQDCVDGIQCDCIRISTARGSCAVAVEAARVTVEGVRTGGPTAFYGHVSDR